MRLTTDRVASLAQTIGPKLRSLWEERCMEEVQDFFEHTAAGTQGQTSLPTEDQGNLDCGDPAGLTSFNYWP
ncbi:hypothetical protein [Cryobacterium sp. GrIS_2_6]|uniref:hypothetical protein n=1 Tax=Cryobacterium sp. GrIS_2_6 TaxID=3162785 RepID=UPI002E0AF07A|nr:hypothetical protein [Cryobacterium psychrotolerans]